MRIRLSASWKSNCLPNDIQMDHLVSCKCQVGVIFQNTTFVQLGQMQGHTVASLDEQHPPSYFLLVFEQQRLSSGYPLLCECVCECEYVYVHAYVCVHEVGSWREPALLRELSLLKMMLLIPSVHKKGKF